MTAGVGDMGDSGTIRGGREKRGIDAAFRQAPRIPPETGGEGAIEGRNAVMEALRAGREIDKVFVSRGEKDRTIAQIVSKARDSGAVVVEVDRKKLDSMSLTGSHQGIIALAAAKAYSTLDEILSEAERRGRAPLVVVCDGITDEHNLGAVIRAAECAGAHGVVIPKRRSAGLTAVVAKASAGAVEHMRVARVPNISSALLKLKERGLWVYGAEPDGDRSIWETDFRGPVALVIGSEGGGISRLVRETCDFTVRIPMAGKIMSLNASVSAAVVLYEAFRQRSCQNG